jgi:hydroxyethylthiazole kinase-like uncharacterized protein yjeF
MRFEPRDVLSLWPLPNAKSHKYTRGVLGVVAGSDLYPGAAVLTTHAAVATGVGMVRFLGTENSQEAVVAHCPEVVPAGGRVDAWALGPGVAPGAQDQCEKVRQAVRWAITEHVPTVVDAGGFGELPEQLVPWIVLTPHAGELARLLTDRGVPIEREQVENDPVRSARKLQEVTGATVLLKGASTVVVGPDGTTFVQADGTPWLATAVAGDILTGILGALFAGHGSAVAIDPIFPAQLAAMAALIHGMAGVEASGLKAGDASGRIGGPIGAHDVIAALKPTIRSLLALSQ